MLKPPILAQSVFNPQDVSSNFVKRIGCPFKFSNKKSYLLWPKTNLRSILEHITKQYIFVKPQNRPYFSKQDLEILEMDQVASSLNSELGYDQYDSVDSEAGSSGHCLEVSGLVDLAKKTSSDLWKVELSFSFLYESGLWILLHGEEPAL